MYLSPRCTCNDIRLTFSQELQQCFLNCGYISIKLKHWDRGLKPKRVTLPTEGRVPSYHRTPLGKLTPYKGKILKEVVP